MEAIVSFFADAGLDYWGLLKAAAILLLGSLLISSVTHFVFHKKTMLGHAVSSSIAIIFIYVVMVLILTMFTNLRFLVTPLPFASLSESQIQFFSFHGASYTSVASQLLSMVILAFLVNLVDTWMPTGKNILSWVFWRFLTVAAGFLLHCAVSWIFCQYLPQGIQMYAPVILLAILLVMLLTGALRFLVGLVLTTVNPLIAALYTFFFASLVGKQITKAVLTTGILSGVILLLEKLGITTLSLLSGALVAYIPFLLILIVVWYIVNRL